MSQLDTGHSVAGLSVLEGFGVCVRVLLFIIYHCFRFLCAEEMQHFF